MKRIRVLKDVCSGAQLELFEIVHDDGSPGTIALYNVSQIDDIVTVDTEVGGSGYVEPNEVCGLVAYMFKQGYTLLAQTSYEREVDRGIRRKIRLVSTFQKR